MFFVYALMCNGVDKNQQTNVFFQLHFIVYSFNVNIVDELNVKFLHMKIGISTYQIVYQLSFFFFINIIIVNHLISYKPLTLHFINLTNKKL